VLTAGVRRRRTCRSREGRASDAPAAEADLRAEIDRLEWVLTGASKLPWSLVGGTHDREIVDDHGCHVVTAGTVPDALLVVAAVNALQRLVEQAAEAARLRDTVARVRAECDYLADCAVESHGWTLTAANGIRRALDGTDA
jgi:hypothetical protein